MRLIQQEQSASRLVLNKGKTALLFSVLYQEQRIVSSYVTDLSIFPSFLRQLTPVEKKADDFPVFFRLVTQIFSVIAVELDKASFPVCSMRRFGYGNADLPAGRIVSILFPAGSPLLFQKVALRIVAVPDDSFPGTAFRQLIFGVVTVSFRLLPGFFFQTVSCRIVSIPHSFPVLYGSGHRCTCSDMVLRFFPCSSRSRRRRNGDSAARFPVPSCSQGRRDFRLPDSDTPSAGRLRNAASEGVRLCGSGRRPARAPVLPLPASDGPVCHGYSGPFSLCGRSGRTGCGCGHR